MSINMSQNLYMADKVLVFEKPLKYSKYIWMVSEYKNLDILYKKFGTLSTHHIAEHTCSDNVTFVVTKLLCCDYSVHFDKDRFGEMSYMCWQKYVQTVIKFYGKDDGFDSLMRMFMWKYTIGDYGDVICLMKDFNSRLKIGFPELNKTQIKF